MEMENEVEKVLTRAQEEGLFSNIKRCVPSTPKIDFVVEKEVDGTIVSRSFGMTTSLKSWNLRKNGPIPELCFPIGTKPETILRRVNELFNA